MAGRQIKVSGRRQRVLTTHDIANLVASQGSSGPIDYNTLINKPALGTAAAHADTDFATAAQGAKADSAVQPGSLATVATTGQYGDLLGTPTVVNSFNGRSGVVTPASGDYTPAQVGAEPSFAAGTTSQYRRGDKTWQDFATDVRAAVLTGLSTATSAVIAATDSVLAALGKLQAQITDNLLPSDYISGLQMVWVSGTAFTIKTGAAYVQGVGKALRVTSDIAKTGLTLTASTWYHVYLYNNAGTPDVEIVTTAPATPYNGNARSKTSDNSRRYLGSILTDSGANLWPFTHLIKLGYIGWFPSSNGAIAPFRVLSNGTATVGTTVSLSGIAPVSFGVCTAVRARFENLSNVVVFVATSNNSSIFVNRVRLEATNSCAADMELNGATGFSYQCNSAPTSSGFYIDVNGFFFER